METVIKGILHTRPSALWLIHLSQVDETDTSKKKISLRKTMALYKELILLWLPNVLTGIYYNMQYTSFVIIYCLKDVKLIWFKYDMYFFYFTCWWKCMIIWMYCKDIWIWCSSSVVHSKILIFQLELCCCSFMLHCQISTWHW